ncbi:hypothetical protein F5148DRAFT_1295782 [Russula earlei]|uniref:Uncharacterized protein n=1 Tax=Russula earlei TaxID=71964 RepID=A0ACC0TR61_9AGAM|nr:hypothetical protein F5148DRAFT_1295782 [Russula earlei]
MARIENGNLIGAVGPVVFYTVKGKTFARSKRKRAKKRGGKFVSKTNNDFTLVSSSATPMINRLKEGITMPFTLQTYNDLRGWILRQYKQYGFNPEWPLVAKGNMCQVNDMSSGQINVSIPAFNPVQNIKVPPYTIQVKIKVMAVATPFTGEIRYSSLTMNQYDFAYSDTTVPAKDFVLHTGAKTNDVAIIVIAVEYALVSATIYSKELINLPAAIINQELSVNLFMQPGIIVSAGIFLR